MAIKLGMRGDTLIEVMLAVGIFSMVAVAVVSVMSSGSSSSQTALEATLAREEIDTQAETLRFIHRSYITDLETGTESKFYNLWKAITDQAINPTKGENDNIGDFAKFSPQTCQELYDDRTGSMGEVFQEGFVLDPRGLVDYDINGAASINSVLYVASDAAAHDKFKVASTYPHLIYGGTSGATDLNSSLIDHSTDINSAQGNFYRAEGIYIIAVRDPDDTHIVGSGTGSGNNKTSAYYDFYIRTCWYGTGDQSPSTVSTVIRLYNPDIAQQ